MARSTKGRLFKRKGSKNYSIQFYVNGKEIKRVLKDNNGKPITNQKLAQKAADKLIAPYLAKDEVQRREQAYNALKTAEEKAKDIEDQQNILELQNTWQAYLDAPIDDKPNSGAGTIKNYQRHWKQFIDWLSNNHPELKYFNDDLTENIAKEYADHLRKLKIADSTFNYKLTTVKLVTRVLMKSFNLKINIWDSIKRINNPKQSSKDIFTFEQGVSVLDIFNKPFEMMHKEQMRVIFAIGVYSGLRLTDCVLLKWNNIISFHNGLAIKCIPQKTQRLNKEIIAPIVEPLQDIFNYAQQWKSDSEYICPDVVERFNYNSSGVRKDLIKVFKHAGYTVSKTADNSTRKTSAVGFHSLRHALFSHLASKGVTIEKLANWSGDSQKTLLKYYLHADNNKLIAEAQEIINSNDVIEVPVKPQVLITSTNEPERDELYTLINKLPIEKIKELLKLAKS